jgi:hypothetical protein
MVSWPKSGDYSGVYGTNYVVQTSPNLANWTNVPANDPNLVNGNPLKYSLTGSGPIFVRLKIIVP